MTLENEKLLIKELKAGDKKAFTVLFDYYSPHILQFCRSYIKNIQDVEEIVEDVFISLWENRKKLRATESVKPFLVINARNKILNHIRKQINSPVYEDYMENHHDNLLNMNDSNLEYEEFEKSIIAVIDSLPSTQNKVIKMSRLENLSNPEIAHNLNLNIQTVKNALSQGLKTIREKVKDIQFLFLNLFF